jgi:ABC-type transport system involved in multi-copper enzyme maturation permease subunit
MSALFGILQLDRGEPLGYANLAGLVEAWLQDAGGFAAVGLVLYLLYALSVPTDKSQSERLRVPVTTWMLTMGALAGICYLGVLALLLLNRGGEPPPPPVAPGSPIKVEPPALHLQMRPVLLAVAGLFALLGFGEPFVRDLVKVRGRRVWALAKLGFKEATRFRVHWLVLALVLLPFLFRNVWMSSTRPADEFRTLVVYVTFWDTVLVIAIGLLLASFSLPNDIKNLTIHTVVTKPVERFEVVLGRFLGYAGLMTLTLAGMTVVNLVLIGTATIDPAGMEEAAKARVPVRGKLEFKSRRADFEGTNVGREFEYRKYIAGDVDSPQRAIWRFPTVPASIAGLPADAPVPVEFTFDVFKLTKGEENRGVDVTFRFVTFNCPQVPPRQDQRGEWQWADRPGEERGGGERRKHEYEEELSKLPRGSAAAKPGTPGWEALSRLAEKYGYYEIRGKEVFDYKVMGVQVPAGLFKNAAQGDPGTDAGPDGKPRPAARVSVYVKCESRGQMLGMAEPDLYVLEGNQPFALNFAKGMVGLWCQLCIVIALAIACSTYLSGVLSLLVALVVFLLGYATDHLNDLAYNRSVGGGPFESMSRLVRAETPTAQLTESAGTRALAFADKGWAWVVRRIQNVIPDVKAFDWTHFVSEGFNVSTEYLVLNVLVMAGYLLPWAVLAYYLMKSREVAA